MIKRKLIIALAAIAGFSSISEAELIYSDGKWEVKGGILEKYFSSPVEATTAVEAMNRARSLQEQGNYKEALEYYKSVYTRYPASILAPEALYQTGQIRVSRNQYSDAFNAYQTIITDYPSYPKFDEVIKAQFEIASLLQKGKRPYYWGVIPGFRDYKTNMEFFESIVTNAPYNYYAPFALMNIADLAIENKKTEDAIDALDRIVNDYPDSLVAPDAFLKLGDVYMCMVKGPAYDQGATIEAMHHYEDFIFFYPDHEKVCVAEEKLAEARDTLARSKLVMGDFYYKYRNNPRAARTFFNETITMAPNSPAASTAENQLERIDNGILANRTVVDMVFGRYKRPSAPAYLQGAEIEKQESKKFFLKPLDEELKEDEDGILQGDELGDSEYTTLNSSEGESISDQNESQKTFFGLDNEETSTESFFTQDPKEFLASKNNEEKNDEALLTIEEQPEAELDKETFLNTPEESEASSQEDAISITENTPVMENNTSSNDLLSMHQSKKKQRATHKRR